MKPSTFKEIMTDIMRRAQKHLAVTGRYNVTIAISPDEFKIVTKRTKTDQLKSDYGIITIRPEPPDI